LSSWDMLNLSHHFILQYLSYCETQDASNWNTNYEVLGDDIVIFDKKLSTAYHRLMTSGLGVEINLSKSLISPQGNAFEFAKKTIWFTDDVSGIPLKGFLQSSTFSTRMALFEHITNSKLLTINRLLAIFNPDVFLKGKNLFNKRFQYKTALGIKSCLGSLAINGRFSLRGYLSLLLNPIMFSYRYNYR
jgi:hypothetical protein